MKKFLVPFLLLLFTLSLSSMEASTNSTREIVTIPYDALIMMNEVDVRYVYIIQEMKADSREFIMVHKLQPIIFFEKVNPGVRSENFIVESEQSKEYKTAWFITTGGDVIRFVEIPEMKTIIFPMPLKLGNGPIVLEVEKGSSSDQIAFNPDLIDRDSLIKRSNWIKAFSNLLKEKQMERALICRLTTLRKLAIETSKKISLE